MAITTTQITPSTGDAAMRALKDFWVASGAWEAVASGDGASAYGAASDIITADSGANSFANYTGGGVANAWWRGRVVGTTAEVLITRGSASTTWWIRYSLLGFSGGSPSATVPPTATDQQNVRGTALTGTQLLPADGSYQLSCCVDSTTKYSGASVRLTGGTPSAQSVLARVPLQANTYPTTPTADADPFVWLAGYANPIAYTNFTDGSVTSNFSRAWSRPGLGAAAWTSAILNLDSGNSSGSLHAIDSKELAPEVAAQMANASLGAYYGPKGILSGVRAALSSTTVSPNGTYLVDGSDRFIRWGPLWLLWGSTEPT